MHTNINATILYIFNVPVSFNSTAERTTPNIGVTKPNIAIFDTGLYLSSIPHREYATADTHARYKSMATEAGETISILPPINSPTKISTIPPNTNW